MLPVPACIGYVHLKVADLERSLAFYVGVLGFDVMQRLGDSAAFFPQEGIRTILLSTRGRAWVAPRLHPDRPGFTTRPSFTRLGLPLPMRCTEYYGTNTA